MPLSMTDAVNGPITSGGPCCCSPLRQMTRTSQLSFRWATIPRNVIDNKGAALAEVTQVTMNGLWQNIHSECIYVVQEFVIVPKIQLQKEIGYNGAS